MRRYLSVFGLFVRSSLYKVLGILALMCGIEWFLFRQIMERGVGTQFSWCVKDANISLAFCVGFLLIMFVLCLPGMEHGSKVGYTLKRLSVEERAVFFCQVVCNLMILGLVWAVQLVMIFGFSIYYQKVAPDLLAMTPNVFLSFYRDDFLHALLPLEDITLWIRNVALLTGLAFSTANVPRKQRNKKMCVSVLVMGTYSIANFQSTIGNVAGMILALGLTGCVLFVILTDVYKKEGSYDS